MMLKKALSFCFVSSLVLGAMAGSAAAFEKPPSSKARVVLGKLAKGPNYTVNSTVHSDGFLYIFTVNSKYGRFTIHGKERLIARLRELAALHILEQKSKSKAFTKALTRGATSPIRLAGDVVKNPVGTIGKTITGVGSLFGRIASGVSNPKADPDSLATSLLGVSSAKRKLAHDLHVDPYTFFKPLHKALDDMATATALGGLAVSIGFSAVPGSAGLLLSRTTTANSVRGMVRDKTPAQLQDTNRERMRRMGVGRNANRQFLKNKFYSPTDKTAIVSSLYHMGAVKNRKSYIARSRNANSLDLAYFLRRRAELLARYQKKTRALYSFTFARGLPVNLLRDGRILALAPLDQLAWTKTSAKAFSVITKDLKRRKGIRGMELHITGHATPMARKMLKKMGWKVVENIGA